MALYGFSGTLTRIMKTNEDGPVVVVVTDKYDDIKGRLFDVFFYGTVYGHRIEHHKPDNYVGKFHKKQSPTDIMNKLREALKR